MPSGGLHQKLYPPSKRVARGTVYDAAVRAAAPGDLVFLITGTNGVPAFSPLSRLYRRWQGVVSEDTALWHTAVYTGAEKERRGSSVRPKMIHAHRRGVTEEHIPPSFFTSERDVDASVVSSSRLEILRYEGITERQREQVVAYCRSKLGKPFTELGWRHDFMTYAFGFPCLRLDPARVSCHGLAFEAYERAGISFPHHLEAAPIFNLGRYVGHPFGHPADRASSKRLYLRDHHLYRDNRFRCLLAAFDHPETGELLVIENPGKYSWNPKLREVYRRHYRVESWPSETIRSETGPNGGSKTVRQDEGEGAFEC